MRIALYTLILSLPAVAAQPLDLLLHFETGSAGDVVTPAVMTNAATARTNFMGGRDWSANASNYFTISNWKFPFPAGYSWEINGTNNGAGTRGIAVEMGGSAGVSEYLQWFFTATKQLTFGCFVCVGLTNGVASYDTLYLEVPGTVNSACPLYTPGAAPFWNMHGTSNSTTMNGGPIYVSVGETNWITIQVTPTNATMAVYNPFTWQQVGTNSTIGRGNVENANMTKVRLLKYLKGATQPGRYTYWDNLAISTSAAFPLLPSENPLDSATIQAQINALSSGQTLTLAAGAATWTNAVYLTNGVSLNATNVWITNGMASTTTPLIYLQGGTLAGLNAVGTNWGCGVQTIASSDGNASARITGCSFTGLKVGVFQEGWGLVDHCTGFNCETFGRNYGSISEGGNRNWTNLYPIAWTSTNYSFWEDCTVTNNRGQADGVFESNAGGAYVVRHCTFYSETTNSNVQLWDAHGDSSASQKGTLAVQWYANTAHYSGGAYASMMADLRGGRALIYSNTVSGNPSWNHQVVQYRIQEMFDASHNITNSYVWANVENGIGIALAPGTDLNLTTNNILVGTHILTNAPETLSAPPYPHPLISGEPNPTPEETPGVSAGSATATTVHVGTLRRQ